MELPQGSLWAWEDNIVFENAWNVRPLVSFTNPLAAGSGLVERTPKKVGFLLWTPVVKKIYIAAGKLGTYSESSTHELSKNHIEK